MSFVSNDDLAVLRSAFNKYDEDKSGSLSNSEFIMFLKRLGRYVNDLKGVEESTANAVFALLDKNADGRLTFNEFCTWWISDASEKYTYFTGDTAPLLRKAYNLYKLSTRGEGRMSYNQFENLLDKLGIEHTDYDFDDLDQDEDGLLSFPEFCDWLNWF